MTRPAHAQEPDDARLGTTIGGFTVDERIAVGPLATIYRGRDAAGERAAMKLYSPSASAELGERATREELAQARVRHPSVAPLLGSGVDSDGTAYLISRWIDGAPLEDHMTGAMDVVRLVRAVGAIAEGLSAIHRAGILHRDLKPSNIIVPDGEPAAVIVDFGHSLLLDAVRITQRGWVLGSPAYMAPEQASGAPLDGRCDLYALGVILYRGLTGTLPFSHASPAELSRMHLWQPVVPPKKRAPERPIPSALEHLCMWLLAKEPPARVPNAHVLVVTLRAMEADLKELAS